MQAIDENKQVYLRLKRQLEKAGNEQRVSKKELEKWDEEILKLTKLIKPFRELYYEEMQEN